MNEQREDDLRSIEEAMAIESGASTWELQFFESLADWMESHDSLTETQRTKLEEILEKLS